MTDQHMSGSGIVTHGRRWRALCTALVVAMLAMACGGAADSESSATAPDAPATTQEEPATEATATEQPATEATTEQAAGGECEGASELRGEKLEISIPFPPGGGFDRQGRVIGDALAEEFGITPVPVNETGAGGLVALNQHVTSDPGKLRIQYVQTPSSLAAQMAGAEGANFSLEDWPWLARVTIDPQIAIASVDSGIESLEEAFGGDQQPRMGALGPGGIDYLHAQVLPVVFNSDAEVVTGFGSPKEAALSVAAGDIDMYVLDERALLPTVEAGDAVPLARISREESEKLPDIPVVTDLVEDGTEEADLLEDYLNLIEIGRGLAAVPGADEETVETLRCMLETVLTDQEVVDLIEIEGDQMAYASGPEMQESIAEVIESGGQFVGLLEQSFQ